jgi:hypothetical protein
MTRLRFVSVSVSLLVFGFLAAAAGQSPAPPVHPIVLHAARLLDIKSGRIVKPGEVLVQGERIVAAGTSVKRLKLRSSYTRVHHFSADATGRRV